MNVLYLTNSFPYPLTSGYLRHYFLIRELSAAHAVTLLSIVGPSFAPRHAEALAPFTRRILTFASPTRGRSAWHKLRHCVRGPLAPPEAGVAMRAAIERLRAEGDFDAALVSGRDTLPALGALAGLPTVIDLCDASAMRIRRGVRYAAWRHRPVEWLKYRRMQQDERALLRHAGHVTFVGRRDLTDVIGDGALPASVVPIGVDLDYWTRARPALGARTIVFTGAMDYAPNADAALHLVTRIFPLVRRRVPGAELLVVGRDPSPNLVRAGARDGVTVTGRVDDVRPYLERASVFGAPLRFGAGMQNKLLEAMAMAVPVVASPLAADGLGSPDGERPPLRVAGTAEDFASALVERLAVAEADPTPDLAARRYVETHFLWERCAARLERVLVQAVRSAGRSRPADPHAPVTWASARTDH